MGSYRAEIAASEASPVRDDRVLDHVIGRNPLAFVARMRSLGERQVPERIHLLRRGWRVRWIDLDISVPYRLDDSRRMHHVGMGLDQVEILRNSLLVGQAFLIGMQHQRVLDLPFAAHPKCNLRDLVDRVRIPHVLDGPGEFEHRLLPHPVA